MIVAPKLSKPLIDGSVLVFGIIAAAAFVGAVQVGWDAWSDRAYPWVGAPDDPFRHGRLTTTSPALALQVAAVAFVAVAGWAALWLRTTRDRRGYRIAMLGAFLAVIAILGLTALSFSL